MARSSTPRHSKKSPQVMIEHEPEPVTVPEPVAEQAANEVFQSVDKVSKPVEEVLEANPEAFETEPDAKPQPEYTPAAAPASQSASISHFVSGLAGGVIALLGAAALQWGGILPSVGTSSEVSVLKQQVTKLLEAPAVTGLDETMVNGLKAAQTGLQNTLESMSAELTTVTTATRQLADEFNKLKSSGAAGGSAAISAFNEKLAALEAQLRGLNPTDNSAQIAALEEKIAEVGQGGGAANVAQAIAAAGLKAAIDRGGAFANELETYATVAPQSPELEQLKNLAATGVPSRSELVSAFGEAANAMIAASQVSDPDAGFLERLTNSAKGMVRSRPVGAVEGDTVEAVVSRMEVAINRGDLDAAVLESAKLPDEARAAGADFLAKLTARRDADALVSKALTSALSASGAIK
jgi:hypothetical protein